MNAHLAKFLMYYEIHRLKREDHSVRKIGELLGLNRRTIRMTRPEKRLHKHVAQCIKMMES